MKKRILITGVQGFLGQAMHRHLLRDRRYEVFGLARRHTTQKNILRCDLLKPLNVSAVVKKIKPSMIFHLAGSSVGTVEYMREANVVSTKNLLEAIKDTSVRVIVPGSAAEYGKASAVKLIKETQKPKPVSDYGRVKMIQTTLALSYAARGVDVVVARIFNITGADIPSRLAAGRFAQQIVQMERQQIPPVIRTFGLDGQRDFVDIRDVCRALTIIAEQGQRGKLYHIASATPTKIRHLLDIFLMLARIEGIEIIEQEEHARRSFDAIGSFAKLKSLGWTPEVTLRKSIEETLRSYRKQH